MMHLRGLNSLREVRMAYPLIRVEDADGWSFGCGQMPLGERLRYGRAKRTLEPITVRLVAADDLAGKRLSDISGSQ
jgi:hypothetical protein